jgi:hypothetical protein
MATETKNSPQEIDQYESKFKQDYESDWQIHKNYIQSFDAYEAMLTSVVFDSVSGQVDHSKITDSYATTLAKERADRVIAKMPEGATEPMGKADIGKAAFMDILRTKYIMPNANAQHPLMEKFNMWQFYSSVYGYMPMFYDWNISPSGYVGPDCWLWNPRDLVPQQGRASISDMEYVTALTWVNKSYLKDLLEDDNEDSGWDEEAIAHLLEICDTKTPNTDTDRDSKVNRDRMPGGSNKGICLATRYEAGEEGYWTTFAPDYGSVQVRRLKNPHENGRIPFVVKYSQPLFDSFYGLGDFQRAKPLQFARDGLTNFYFEGIKMNLVPPVVANANGVVKHTLDYRPGGIMLETIPNSIRRLETSTAGLSTFQAAQSNLTGSLLSLFGSQNASIPGAESLNPSQGKTPQAISMFNEKEATRDGAERRHLEAAIEQLFDGFFSLIANVGTEEVPITLFRDDIKSIFDAGMQDVAELFKGFKPNASMTAGVIKIKPGALKGVEYRFRINPDSTAKINKAAQLQSLLDMMDRLGKYQNVLQDDPTITIHWDKIMGAYKELTDIPMANEFISFDPEAKKEETPPPMKSPIQLPNGDMIEMDQLIALYGHADQNETDWPMKQQIAQLLGFEATMRPPTPSGSGMLFNDPSLAASADAIMQLGQPAPAPAAAPTK